MHFEYASVDGTIDRVACLAHHVRRRAVPRPVQLISAWRQEEAESAAARAARATGCPCRFVGTVAREPAAEDGATATLPAGAAEEIQKDTELQFEWEHVQTAEGVPHVVTIRYEDLKYLSLIHI